MSRTNIAAYVAHEPAPALRPGQIIVAGSLSSSKSGPALSPLRARGNDLIFPPPYSPDLTQIEMAFSKLKTLIRKAAARTCDALQKEVGAVFDPFQPQERRNYLKDSGYGAN